MPVDETETRWWEKTYQQEGATRRRRRSWSGADNLTPARQHCMTHCTALRCTSWLVAQVSALSDCLIHAGPGGRPDLRKTLVGSRRYVLTSPTYWSISILSLLLRRTLGVIRTTTCTCTEKDYPTAVHVYATITECDRVSQRRGASSGHPAGYVCQQLYL